MNSIQIGDKVEAFVPDYKTWVKVRVTRVYAGSFHGQDKNFNKLTGLKRWRYPDEASPAPGAPGATIPKPAPEPELIDPFVVTDDIVSRVKAVLDNTPKSMSEIAKELDSTALPVLRALQKLRELGEAYDFGSGWRIYPLKPRDTESGDLFSPECEHQYKAIWGPGGLIWYCPNCHRYNGECDDLEELRSQLTGCVQLRDELIERQERHPKLRLNDGIRDKDGQIAYLKKRIDSVSPPPVENDDSVSPLDIDNDSVSGCVTLQKAGGTARGNNKYYWYMWRENGKQRRKYIGGGHSGTAIANTRANHVKDAIATGKSPKDIIELINSFSKKHGN